MKKGSMNRLIIVRHGETVENELNICQGQDHGTLSEKGIKENEKLGQQMAEFSFQTIYSSPLNRALQTAQVIQKHKSSSRIIKDERLMERNLGILQGKAYPKRYAETDLYENMETIDAVSERVKSFLNDLKELHINETIVVVSHGYLIKVMFTLLRNMPLNQFYTVTLMNNSSYQTEILNQDFEKR